MLQGCLGGRLRGLLGSLWALLWPSWGPRGPFWGHLGGQRRAGGWRSHSPNAYDGTLRLLNKSISQAYVANGTI
eukprot:2723108-Pyramimonas_sp.AAC.1